ncbi:MAG: ATP-binding cassette domain-containing protein [Gammaproteobacteria bacterium]|jgi:tungstate transport system ATP-binding protein|nr:ATP-binding cassette domain-containing protein [Gammaproteobacteria bacterium]
MPDVVTLRQARPVEHAGESPEPIGEVRGLVYEAGGKRLIDGIDLDIPRDSRTVVMGPNGAGKSLLLRLLHGLLTPTSGEIRWSGRRLDTAVRREQTMVFQRPVLLRRSAAANIRFVLKQRDRVADGEVERLLDEVGLADLAGQPARLLSGGEQQRLTLARALATRPRVLFLDEPTASLDPASTAVIEAIVQRAHKRGTKIIFVTHNLGQARRLADDVLFIHKGRPTEHSPAQTFFDRPSSQAAIDYLEDRLVLR